MSQMVFNFYLVVRVRISFGGYMRVPIFTLYCCREMGGVVDV